MTLNTKRINNSPMYAAIDAVDDSLLVNAYARHGQFVAKICNGHGDRNRQCRPATCLLDPLYTFKVLCSQIRNGYTDYAGLTIECFQCKAHASVPQGTIDNNAHGIFLCRFGCKTAIDVFQKNFLTKMCMDVEQIIPP